MTDPGTFLLALLVGFTLWANTTHKGWGGRDQFMRLIALCVAAFIVLTLAAHPDLLGGPEDRVHM